MTNQYFHPSTVIGGCAIGAIALAAGAAVCAADDRPRIDNGEAAYIAWQVQNTMSKHAFLHAAGMNLEEVDTLWVSPDGEFAPTATFASPAWVMYGLQTVRNAYGLENQANRERALEQVNRLFPEVEFTEANLGAGHEWAMHTNTTPIIEVAGDGKTAKGVWYSPGVGLMARISGNQANAGSVFFWEKYGGDFVLEDGRWKIWHLQMAYDFTPGFPAEMTARLTVTAEGAEGLPEGAAGGPGGPGGLPGAPPGGPGGDDEPMREAGERMGPELPPGFRQPAYSYPLWSPLRPSLIYPRLPEPYYTFSETFSYCNCDDTAYPDNSATYGIVDLSQED